jgi:hypothetical protein
MVASIKWKSKIILAKIEATYNVDPTPTGAANAMLMTDVTLTPMDGEDVPRNLELPYFGAQDEYPVGLRAVLEGNTELVGSGAAGTAPKWGPLARACSLAETISAGVSVTYNPIQESQESVAVHFYVGGTRHVFLGTRGDGDLMLNAQGIPVMRWKLTGIWSVPTEQTRPTPVFTGWQKPAIVTSVNTPTFSLGGTAFVMRNATLKIGSEIKPRFLVGRDSIDIVDRNSELAASVEAVPLTTFDPFSRAIGFTTTAVSIVHGTAAGYITTIAAPAGVVRRLTGYEVPDKVLEWPLRIGLKPSSGNDDFTITLT